MTAGGVEWSAAGFFLVALILFRQCERLIKADSAEGHRRLAGGLALLSLTALARLYQSEGMFQQVPFLSETLFFDLAYLVVMIAGGAMIVSGAAYWLPLARQNKQFNQDKISRLDLIRRIEQLVGVENRLDTILSHSLLYMKDAANLGTGLVFKFSSDGERLRLVAATPDFEGDARELERALCARIRARHAAGKTADLARFLPDCLSQQLGRFAAAIPLEVSGHVIGLFAFWGKDRGEFDSNTRLILHLAADVIARKVALDSLRLKLRCHDEHLAWQEKTRSLIETASEPGSRFTQLARNVAERFQADAVSLAILPRDSWHLRRYTWTLGDRLLVEHRLPLVPVDALTGPAYHAGETLVFSDLSKQPRPSREEMLTMPSARSLLVMPLRIIDDVVIVLTLASEQGEAFSKRVVAEIRRLSPLISLVVLPDLVQQARQREASRMERLTQVLKSAGGEDNRQALLVALARLAAEEFNADLVRISQIDETTLFLESRALASTPSWQCSVPPNGRIILALAPMHEEVVRSGQSIILTEDGGRAKLTQIEAAQTLVEGIRSAAIVPVILNEKCLGAISLGSVDHELDGLREQNDWVFAEVIAEVAALSFESEIRAAAGHEWEATRRSRLEPIVGPNTLKSKVEIPAHQDRRLHADVFS